MIEIKEKNALITGSSRGVGKQLARKIIRQVQDLDIRIDILYNNAATMTPFHGAYWEPSWEEWTETFKVNVMAMCDMCAAFIPGMIENSFGRVINLTSGIRHSLSQ